MDILMPQLGETVAEGKITKWFKQAGDEVRPGENLFEIETDKTSMEVPSTVGGKLTAVNFKVGDVAKVGAVVAVIGGAGVAQTPSVQPAAAPPQPLLTPANPPSLASRASVDLGSAEARSAKVKAGVQSRSVPVQAALDSRWSPPSGGLQARPGGGNERTDHRGFAYPNMDPFREVRTPDKNYGPARIGGRQVTPLARRLAGERGIDLGDIKGSGPHGRIVANDLESAIPRRAEIGPTAAQVKALYEGVAYEEVPLDSRRAAIARRLAEAKSTIPHFYLTADIEIGRLVSIREEANAAAPRNETGEPAFKLSLNDFIIKAWAAALQRVPAANAVWAGDHILRFKSSDIGVAVALDDGLITPVIRSAEIKSLTAISAEIREVTARARDKKLKPTEYQGGASAISNLGMHGVREFSAIIIPPHATILAVGASRRAPVEAEDGSVRFVTQMTVTLSCDHRVIDGALGARLLGEFGALMRSPMTALV